MSVKCTVKSKTYDNFTGDCHTLMCRDGGTLWHSALCIHLVLDKLALKELCSQQIKKKKKSPKTGFVLSACFGQPFSIFLFWQPLLGAPQLSLLNTEAA